MQTTRKRFAKEAARARTGREVDEATLRELYIEKRATQTELADYFGVSRSLVRDWLHEHGITRDDRPAVAL